MAETDLRKITIEKVVAGGYGLARLQGETLLVPYVLPGEEVEVEISERRRGVAWGILRSLISPHSERRQPPCPYYGECGGCSLQHASYPLQIEMKKVILKESLLRLGGIDRPVDIAPSTEFGYRMRMRLRMQGETDRGLRGFYRAQSHQIRPIERCLLLPQAGNEALPQLIDIASRLKYKGLSSIDLLTLPDGDVYIRLLFENRIPDSAAEDFLGLPHCSGIWAQENKHTGSHGQRAGKDHAQLSVRGIRYFASPECFFQVNLFMHEVLLDALESAIGSHGNLGMDFYCGVGFFSLPLSRHFQKIIGIEENPAAIRLAYASSAAAGIGNVQFVASGVAPYSSSYKGQQMPDLLVVDPPRAGLSPEVIDCFARTPRVIYFSCDIATLARDLRRFMNAGHEVVNIRAFDLFPQTPEVEVMAELRRK